MTEAKLCDSELGDEFHRLVNMSARELAGWLHTLHARSAVQETDDLQPDTPTGRRGHREPAAG